MAKITRTLSSLSNGVSRQPAILRASDQTHDELNTWGRIATGLDRRPPAEHVAEIDAAGLETAHVHHINRDVSERYLVLIDDGLLKVFDQADGTEKTVNAPDGLGYLDASGSAYRAMTVADFTFVVNVEKVPALLAAGDDLVAQPATYRWLGGSDSGNLAGTEYQFEPNPTTDGAVTGVVQKFEDLPTSPTAGQVYEVKGSAETGFVSYYVAWDGDVWNETVLPGLANAIDAETMPHALVREADGTFTFAPFSWAPRRMGNTGTNPNPVFIGRAIRDVFFYQNRLGFLVDETAVFSAAGAYGDFWRRTILDYIDSDVVSVSATTTDVALLDFAIPFNDGVALFSAQRQFSLTNGENGLTASSVSIQPVTGYLTAPGVRPVAMGSQLYFASDANGYTGIQEYTRLDGADSLDAAEVTAHVPRYVPQGVSQLIAAADIDALFVFVKGAEAEADRRKLFVYQFFWDRDKKLQSAWRSWDFGDGEPLSGAYVDGKLSLLMKRDDGYFLERINLNPGAVAEEQDHQIFLDRSISLTGVYDSGDDETTFTLPYAPDEDAFRLVLSAGSAVPEAVLAPTSYDFGVGTVTVPGDYSDAPVTAGQVFTTSVRFSQQFPLDFQGRPVSTGRLQLHTWTVVYEETAYFRAEISPYGPDAVLLDASTRQVLTFTGRLLGTSSLVTGAPAYHTGSFTFPVGADSRLGVIELVNDSPFGSTWVSAEFEGLFWSRAS